MNPRFRDVSLPEYLQSTPIPLRLVGTSKLHHEAYFQNRIRVRRGGKYRQRFPAGLDGANFFHVYGDLLSVGDHAANATALLCPEVAFDSTHSSSARVHWIYAA